jgi:murein DD-endopeptidase MepM/ murein hydrolase activator NlpD
MEKPQHEVKPEEQGALQSWYQAGRKQLRHVRRRWYRIRKEHSRHNFPESDRLLIQLVLFAWNMLGMAGSLLQELTWGRRRQALHKAATGIARVEQQRRARPVAFMLVGCLVIACMVVASMYTRGTTVMYDGEVIAVVASEKEVEQARANLETVTTKTLGQRFTIDESLLQYSTDWMMRQDIVDDQASLEEDLSDEIGLVTEAYCLYVDGVRIGATPYEGALEELLEQLKMASTDENTISCEFAETVEVRPETIPTAEIMNLGHVAETLYSTKTEEVTYEVKRGDTWSQIADKHGLTSKELLALNPGYDINRLQIGEVLTLSASVPYLTMTVVQQERYVDDVQYDIEYTDSADMYQGDYKVTSPGAFGSADVVANVTYINGVETERTVLSSVTLREPVTEHRIQGTKERPTWYPTGKFRWPTSGRITSYFGGRKSPGGIGSTNHKGLDIAAPRGTAIYAADGGTVVSSGWMGGYGYTVRIRHDGTGYETFYAHNSKLLVSAGQHVYKGQQIAKMGSTGNSTGSHCHFEIRYNGVAKNPLNFLS